MIGEFPAQRPDNEKNVSIWWRHHAIRNYINSKGTSSNIANVECRVYASLSHMYRMAKSYCNILACVIVILITFSSTFDNFRCWQRWKFHQNDMLVSMHQCVTFADFHCSRLMVMHVWIHINIWDKRDFIRVFVYLYRHDPEASFYSGGCLRFEHCLHLYFSIGLIIHPYPGFHSILAKTTINIGHGYVTTSHGLMQR